jgi:hypothetical protein
VLRQKLSWAINAGKMNASLLRKLAPLTNVVWKDANKFEKDGD